MCFSFLSSQSPPSRKIVALAVEFLFLSIRPPTLRAFFPTETRAEFRIPEGDVQPNDGRRYIGFLKRASTYNTSMTTRTIS